MKARTPYGKTKIHTTESPLPRSERVLVVPGYSEGIAHNKRLVSALADKGIDASIFSQPRRAGDKDHRVKDPIQRQGNIILSLVENTVPQGESVHAVAHSLGSAATLKAAQLAPARFASVTLMEPSGMVGAQSMAELVARSGKKVKLNQIGALRSQIPNQPPELGGYAARVDTESALHFSGRVAKAQIAGSGVLARQPFLARREAQAAGNYDIADDIARVMALGIPVNIVTAQSDEMFDADKVNTYYETKIPAASSFSSIADPEARHDTFWMQPERTAAIIGQLINKA